MATKKRKVDTRYQNYYKVSPALKSKKLKNHNLYKFDSSFRSKKPVPMQGTYKDENPVSSSSSSSLSSSSISNPSVSKIIDNLLTNKVKPLTINVTKNSNYSILNNFIYISLNLLLHQFINPNFNMIVNNTPKHKKSKLSYMIMIAIITIKKIHNLQLCFKSIHYFNRKILGSKSCTSELGHLGKSLDTELIFSSMEHIGWCSFQIPGYKLELPLILGTESKDVINKGIIPNHYLTSKLIEQVKKLNPQNLIILIIEKEHILLQIAAYFEAHKVDNVLLLSNEFLYETDFNKFIKELTSTIDCLTACLYDSDAKGLQSVLKYADSIINLKYINIINPLYEDGDEDIDKPKFNKLMKLSYSKNKNIAKVAKSVVEKKHGMTLECHIKFEVYLHQLIMSSEFADLKNSDCNSIDLVLPGLDEN
ncbi:uncharacterized protein KGF55_003799 [Candida pseudojiufengensis]|uniref:uncharacterized protein n=1 Tax=Candida pseudojiufengensis TaxID=497109 RepID=UPI00222452B1|nr:uncharacterized protein KGF55_003799 [Candida pseudojiufengensis]KAI5961828.1 hypothetical protein KGF55_003799 [Candida pseudojiufengensis]